MNRYILTSDDIVRILPPKDGESAMLEIICGRTMIFFELAQIESAALTHDTLTDNGTCDAFRLIAPDALLGAQHEIYIPCTRAGFDAFFAQLKMYAPTALDLSMTDEFVPERCDHNGTQHEHS